MELLSEARYEKKIWFCFHTNYAASRRWRDVLQHEDGFTYDNTQLKKLGLDSKNNL